VKKDFTIVKEGFTERKKAKKHKNRLDEVMGCRVL
jgi:hypothetical protein